MEPRQKKVCCLCNEGWEPIATSIGRAHLGVIGDEHWSPPMVNVILDEPAHRVCTIERAAKGWRIQGGGHDLPAGLAGELVEIVSRWAAEHPEEFVEHDREAFHQFFKHQPICSRRWIS